MGLQLTAYSLVAVPSNFNQNYSSIQFSLSHEQCQQNNELQITSAKSNSTHITAQPPHTDRSIVFAGWRQCALPSDTCMVHWAFASFSPQHKRHIDQFRVEAFLGVNRRAQHTHTQTTERTTCVAISRMRCGLKSFNTADPVRLLVRECSPTSLP